MEDMITQSNFNIVSLTNNASQPNGTHAGNGSEDSSDPGPPVVMPTLWDILEQYPTYRWSEYILLYVLPVIIILGIVGNFLSFSVMMRKTMIHSSTCFYLAIIAVVDSLVLFFNGTRKWFHTLNGVDAMTLSPTACKVFNFLTYFSSQYSAWLLVAMTTERFIAIHFPLKAVEYATVSRAKKVSVGLFLTFAIINCHYFWTVTINREFCLPTDEYSDFHDDAVPWIDATLYSFLPFLTLFILNILIIRDNKRATKFRKTIRRGSTTAEGEKIMENRNFHHKLTIMLLSVTFTFLVTSAPKVVLFCIRFEYFEFNSYPIDFERLALYLLVSRTSDLFNYINHAINFFLYCITGQKFRREVKKFCMCKKRSGTNITSSTSDRYRHRPSSTSITNMELSENPAYSINMEPSSNPTSDCNDNVPENNYM